MDFNDYYQETYCSEYTHNDSVPISCLEKQCTFCKSYQQGYWEGYRIMLKLEPNYPVPALTDTATFMALNGPYIGVHNYTRYPLAWDGIWREWEELGWLRSF